MGFKICFLVLLMTKLIESTDCDITYAESSGTITSPGWPMKYNDNVDYTYCIDVVNGITTSFSIVVFETEKSTDRRDGDVLYYGAGDSADKSIADGALSGYIDPAPFEVNNGTLWLRFIANERTTFNGFKINYYVTTSGCDRISTAPTGNFTSPNYPNDYPNNAYCEYIIDVPGTALFSVEFQDFALGTYSDLLYYGVGTNVKPEERIGVLTGFSIPDPLELRNETIWFIFDSDSSVIYKGFQMTWSSRDEASCLTPKSYPNAVYILDETDPFDIGSYAIYSCQPGYQMNGTADSIVHVCQEAGDGTYANWDGPDISCTILQCPDPPVPANGIYEGDTFDYGTGITYTCNEGFVLIGDLTRLCTENGTWSGNDVKCVPDLSPFCDESTALKYNDYSCYIPYNNVYKGWNDARMSCEAIGPDVTLAIIRDNATQMFLEDNLPDVGVNEVGYWIGAQEARKWIWGGTKRNITYFPWTSSEPDNVLNLNEDCIALSGLNDNNFNWADERCDTSNKDDLPFYFICQFDGACPPVISQSFTYKSYCLGLVTNQQSKNNANNYCNNYGGKLVEIDSEDMQSAIRAEIETRMVSGLRAAHWWIGAMVDTSTRYWEWIDGLPVTATFWATNEPSSYDEDCVDLLQDGSFKWNDDFCTNDRGHICQLEYPVPGCGSPGDPSDGTTSPDGDSDVGDFITTECDPGYVLQGPSQRTCTADGVWSDDSPTCKKVNCNTLDIPDLREAIYKVLSEEFGGVVVYRCQNDTELFGYPAIYCNASAKWSSLEANCTALDITTPVITSDHPTTSVETTTQVTTSVPTKMTTDLTTKIPLSTEPGTTPLSSLPITTNAQSTLSTTRFKDTTNLTSTPGGITVTSTTLTKTKEVTDMYFTTTPSSPPATTILQSTLSTTKITSTPNQTATTPDYIPISSSTPTKTRQVTEGYLTTTLAPVTSGAPSVSATSESISTSQTSRTSHVSATTFPIVTYSKSATTKVPDLQTTTRLSTSVSSWTVNPSSSPGEGGTIDDSSSSLVIIIVSACVGVLLILLLIVVLCWVYSCRKDKRNRQKTYNRQQSDIASVFGPSTRRLSYDNNNVSHGAETSFENPADLNRGYSIQSRQTSMDALIPPDSISHQLSMLSNAYENPLFGRTPVRVEQRVSFEYGDSLPLSSMSAVKNSSGAVRRGLASTSAQNLMPQYAQVNRSLPSTFSVNNRSPSYAQVNPGTRSNPYPEAGNSDYNMARGAQNRMPPYAQVNRAAKTSQVYGQLNAASLMSGDDGISYDRLHRFEMANADTPIPIDPPDYDSLDDEKRHLKNMFMNEPEYD